jgi:hypothetical protein
MQRQKNKEEKRSKVCGMHFSAARRQRKECQNKKKGKHINDAHTT